MANQRPNLEDLSVSNQAQNSSNHQVQDSINQTQAIIANPQSTQFTQEQIKQPKSHRQH